jgi:hypothetical protein
MACDDTLTQGCPVPLTPCLHALPCPFTVLHQDMLLRTGVRCDVIDLNFEQQEQEFVELVAARDSVHRQQVSRGKPRGVAPASSGHLLVPFGARDQAQPDDDADDDSSVDWYAESDDAVQEKDQVISRYLDHKGANFGPRLIWPQVVCPALRTSVQSAEPPKRRTTGPLPARQQPAGRIGCVWNRSCVRNRSAVSDTPHRHTILTPRVPVPFSPALRPLCPSPSPVRVACAVLRCAVHTWTPLFLPFSIIPPSMISQGSSR